MSTDYKVCVRDEYGEFDSWEAWQKFHRDRKDIDGLSEYVKDLKEENKRLREAFDLFEKVDARVVWEGLGLGNGLAEEIDECIMRTRAALKEE